MPWQRLSCMIRCSCSPSACICYCCHAAQVVCSRYFDAFIAAMVVGSSVILALDTPHEQDARKTDILRNLDAAFTAIFCCEVRVARAGAQRWCHLQPSC